MRKENEFTANAWMAANAKATREIRDSWMQPSICNRPAPVQVSVVKRVWRAIVGAL